MATVVEKIELLLTSSAKGAVAGLKETEAASTSLDKSTGKLGQAFDKLGISGATALKAGVAGSAVAAGAAVAKFALDGIKQFSDVTAQVRGLRNVMGGTAEDASRVAGAGRALGVDTDTLGKGFFQLSKRIADNKDTLRQNNIEVVRNSDGSLNMAKTLANVSDGYLKITDPAQRNLFLMQNFGKAGTALIPILAQGSEKLQQFYALTAKHGEVFSEDDLQKGKEYKLAMNQLDDAWKGLSVTAGRELIPVVTQFITGLTTISEAIPGAVSDISDFVSNIADATGISTIIGGIGVALDDLGIGGSESLDKVGYAVENVQERFAGLDSAGAAAMFKRINDEAAKSPEHVGRANQALLDFIQIGKSDVGVAAQIIDALKAQGEDTDVYERALRNIIGQKNNDAAATQAQKDANLLLIGTYDQQLTKLDELANALLGQADKGFAAMNAVLSENQALADYNTATTDGATTSDQMAQKLVAIESGALHAAAALGQNAEAQDTSGNATLAHNANIQAQLGYLTDLAGGLAPDSPLRVYLEQYIGRLAATEGDHHGSVSLDTGPADAAITALQQRMGGVGLYGTGYGGPNPNGAVNQYNPNGGGLYGTGPGMPPVGTPGYYGNPSPLGVGAGFDLATYLRDVAGYFGGRASGGPVGAGQLYRVNELGTEYFRPSMDGTVIPLGASTATAGVDKSINVGQMTVVSPEPRRTGALVVQELRDAQWMNKL